MPGPESTRPVLFVSPAGRRVLRWVLWTAALAALVAAAASIGGRSDGQLDPVTGLVVVADTLIRTAWPGLVILLSAVGLGTLAARFFSIRDIWTALALGLAGLTLIVLILGTAGRLSPAVSIGLTALGLVGLIDHLRRSRPRLRPPPGWLWLGLPGLAVLLTAAASPPGTLWSSEYGGYDALSYHLQLPQEWLAAGHTRPVDHNAYSFLPGGLEALFTHLGHLTPGPGVPTDGLLANGGWRLLSIQYLHAGLTIAAAGAIASVTRRLAQRAGLRRTQRRAASALAGGLVLCTPWTVVVGSLAYNEMGVLLLGAAAMAVAVRATHASVSRGTLAAVLVGVACLIKPTALVFVAPVVGLLLITAVPRRRLALTLTAAAVAGAVTLSPWLVRNAVLTGNPVFPLATETLGTGHWSPGQAERFTEAHTPAGSLTDRLRLLVWTDPASDRTDPAVARFRGAANPQWLLAFPLGLAGAGLLLAAGRSHRLGAMLTLCLLTQLLAWLALTHLQSRFLIPCLLTLAPLAGLGLARVTGPSRHPAALAWIFGSACVLMQAGGLWVVWSSQLGGAPASMLLPGPGAMTGEPYSPEIGLASPTAYINHELPPDARVVLVGGATPLYLRTDTRYATVWDDPPAMELIEDGVPPGTYVLVNSPELARLRTSGYLHPGLTPDAIAGLVRTMRPVRVWPELGMGLYRSNDSRPAASQGETEP